MRHLFIMERSEEKREEKGKGKREKGKGKKKTGKQGKGKQGKGEGEAKCSNRVAANSTLGVFNSSLFPLHSSLIFFTLPSALFTNFLNSSFFTLHLFSSLFVLLFLLLLLLSQILRELKSCHIEELMERRYRFHQARNEVGSRTLAIG